VGFIAIPAVAKTYETGPLEARKQLERVLDIVGEPDFPIDCIYRLANEVEHIISADPDFAGMIYEKVFGYEESSSEQTHMGGYVMPMLSNRRQDYGMCRYSLMKEFRRFLGSKPFVAVRTGIRAVQAFAIQTHVLRYVREGKSLRDLTSEFRFRNTTARYMQDGSAIWDESSYPDQEMRIVDAVFEWLGSAARQGRCDDVERVLDIFAGEALLGFMWSRLLIIGADHPAVLGPRLWELAKAKPFLEENDTLFSLGLFLERAAQFVSPEQRAAVEQIILGLRECRGGQERILGAPTQPAACADSSWAFGYT